MPATSGDAVVPVLLAITVLSKVTTLGTLPGLLSENPPPVAAVLPAIVVFWMINVPGRRSAALNPIASTATPPPFVPAVLPAIVLLRMIHAPPFDVGP